MATQISSLTTLSNNANSYDCLLPLVDPTLALNSRNVKIRISTHNEMFSNNFAVSSLSSYSNYFGTGKDGSVTISSSAQISSSTSPAGLNNISSTHGDVIVKNYRDLTINSGVLFSPLRPCRGLIIYCTGNLTVNGGATISMTGKGGGVANKIAAPIGVASSTDSRYDLVDATLYFNNFSSSVAGGYGIPTHWNWAPSGSAWFSNYKMRIPLSGSVAGGAGAPTTGPAGTVGIFCCGAGGAGGSNGPGSSLGGSGGRGTIFAAGGGGGGGGHSPGGTGVSGAIESGGLGGGPSGGGGAGNPQGLAGAGSPIVGTAGATGVGGLLILIVRGSVTINGTLSSNGANGGNGGAFPPGSFGAGGGGGSGGGRIMIIYGGTYINTGTIVANGGSGGIGGTGSGPEIGKTGGAGGAGSTTVKKVHV